MREESDGQTTACSDQSYIMEGGMDLMAMLAGVQKNLNKTAEVQQVTEAVEVPEIEVE